METIADRLQQKLTDRKLSWSKAATLIGLSPQAPSKWKKGQISKETLEKLSELLGVNVGWLLTGEGSSIRSTLNSENVSAMVEANANPITGKPLAKIPVLDFAQAGMWREIACNQISPKGETYTTYLGMYPEAVFSLVVNTMSMAPEFLPGDEIVVDAARFPVPGAMVIAQEIHQGVALIAFKKYRVVGVNEHGEDIVELVPLNPDYPTYNSMQIEISIIGVVVQHHREFKY